MSDIRRIDDLGRIVIPKEIRRQIGAKEGTTFEIQKIADDAIIIRKVNTKENIKENIIFLRNYIRECDEISDETAINLYKKLNEINKIINIEDYKK